MAYRDIAKRRAYDLKKQKQYRAEMKLKVLSHYGPNHGLRCNWPDCDVIDIDMLTLDHVNNDGAEHRKTSHNLYREVIQRGFPEGFQTLCWNHQWKKQILRTRID